MQKFAIEKLNEAILKLKTLVDAKGNDEDKDALQTIGEVFAEFNQMYTKLWEQNHTLLHEIEHLKEK